MTSLDSVLLLSRIVLAVIFGTAGVAKLLDREGARKTVVDFGLPATLAGPMAALLPIAELLCALALLPERTAWWGSVGLLALLAAFTVAMAVALARGRAVDCRCFGQLSPARIGPATLTRNLVLAAIAGLIVVRGSDGVGPSMTTVVTALSGGQVLNLMLVVVIVAGAVVLMQILRQYGWLLVRVEALESRIGAGAPAVAGLPVGTPAPSFTLEALEGRSTTLEKLSANGNPVMLVFVEPACAACDGLLPDVASWQREFDDRLTVALVSRGAAETKAKVAGRKLRHVLIQTNREVADSFEVSATPGAVLIKDGLVASPVATGPDAIRGMAANATLPPPLKRGDPVPSMPARAIDGTKVDLSKLRGRSLVLFWNPGCGFCQQMLDGVKQWERVRTVGGLSLVVVSSGSVAEIQQQGFESTVLLDEASSVSRVFGSNGTPSAVVIHDGRVASDLEIGAPGVWKLAGVRQAVPA